MNEKIGEQLRQARQAKSLSIDEVSEATYIRPRILKALEAGDFGALPSAAQVRGFLRSYAEYLGLEIDDLLAPLQNASPPPEPVLEEERAELVPESEPELTATELQEQPAAPAPDAEPEIDPAQEILAEIGSAMQQRRDMLGLTLDEIEGHTHIPARYLEMIEQGQLNRFPSPTQARGMLGIYADFLNMDTNSVLMRYAEALQTRLAMQQAVEQQTSPRPAAKLARRAPILPLWLRKIISIDVLVYAVIGLVVVAFATWGIGHVLDTRANLEPQPTAPPLAQVLLPSPTLEPTATATELATDEPAVPVAGGGAEAAIEEELVVENATPEITLQPFAGENLQLYIVVRQRAYMRVTVDGKVEFDGRVTPGSNFPFVATQRIEVLTGNGAALQIFYNDTDLGTIGIFGQVANVVYTLEGVQTPTPTVTPTLRPDQITPSPTITRTPTEAK
jgi:cytoskeleton protein RodZ